MSTENDNVTDVPAEAEAAVEAPQGTSDVQEIFDFAKNEVEKIEASEKKSNYHNARRSAYKTIMEMIHPTPPKPKKSKAKAKAAGAGESAGTDAPAVEQPAAATDADTTRVEPIEEGA